MLNLGEVIAHMCSIVKKMEDVLSLGIREAVFSLTSSKVISWGLGCESARGLLMSLDLLILQNLIDLNLMSVSNSVRCLVIAGNVTDCCGLFCFFIFEIK